MTAPRDPNRLISDFLDEGMNELPDRSYDAVRTQIEHTRQRVVFGPWREDQMRRYAIFGIAAAAIVLVAVVGVRFLPTGGGVGVQPTPTSTPIPTPSPTAAAIVLPAAGALQAGSYYIDNDPVSHLNVKRATFTVPDGWTSSDPFVSKNQGEPGEVGFTTWVVTDVYTDACHWLNTSLTHVDSGPDALIRALRDQGGREEALGGWPWQGTVGGYSAEGIALVVPADLDTATCTGHILRYWPDPGPDFNGGLCCNLPGNTDFVYAVDIEGKTLAVVARHYAASSTADIAELDGVINSLRFEP